MITVKEAIEIAKKSYEPGLMIDENGYTEIVDIDYESGYYGFDTNLEPGEEFKTSMLCVSKENGEVCWIDGGFLYANCNMFNTSKEPI